MSLGTASRMLRGLLTYLVRPAKGTGGTLSATYCYSVFLRHFVLACRNDPLFDPKVILELGPGDSIGMGLAALLAGVERYVGVDLVDHADWTRNLLVFDELLRLFLARAPVPCGEDLAEVRPELGDYRFPAHLLSDSRLAVALDPGRIEHLRRTLVQPQSDGPQPIMYAIAPRFEDAALRPESIDMVVSQAVMEHVDFLAEGYAACFKWLKPGGMMSHQIDFRSHNTSEIWNGHWGYSDFEWWAIRGAHTWFINRMPYSTHLKFIKQAGFEIIYQEPVVYERGIPRAQLAKRFRSLSDEDLECAGLFIQARKPAHD